MALTINSNSAPLITPAEFLNRCDWRTVGQLLSDSDDPIDFVTLTTAGTPENTLLLQHLLGSTGELEAACTKGERYQPSDLANLAASGTASGSYLFDVLTWLTIPRIYRRRPDLLERLETEILRGADVLEKLEKGEMVFSFVQTQIAGVITHQSETPRQVQHRDGLEVQATRLYGRRADRRRWPYGARGGDGGF
jgi:hypothetical protein